MRGVDLAWDDRTSGGACIFWPTVNSDRGIVYGLFRLSIAYLFGRELAASNPPAAAER